MSPAVHQLVPVLTPGDGVSSAVLRYQELLTKHGYRSHVYAGLIDRRLRGRSKPASALRGDVDHDDVVIYHLSIGSPLAGEFASLDARKVLFYQNVAPAESVDGVSPLLRHHLRWGRQDLAGLAPIVELSLAPSDFSAQDLAAAGSRLVAIVTLPLDLRRLRPRPAAHDGQTFLFVGRFAPHKRQDVLIRVLYALRSAYAPTARLVLVGSGDVPEYIASLRRFAAGLGVADGLAIHSSGVSDRALGDLYAHTSVYLCASDHEGFCLPLLEAMAFSVPVVAFAGGAVTETVGSGGVVVSHHDPLVWASLASRFASDAQARSAIIGAGHDRLEQLSDAKVARRLGDALALIGIRPPA